MAIDFQKFLRRLVIYEGLKLKEYKDSVGIPTIGIGSIRRLDGTPVQMGDVITEEMAYKMATVEAKHMLDEVTSGLKVTQTENQLIALLCLTYNIGTGGFKSSSVLKSINSKASMTEIEQNWMKWNKGTVNGQKVELPGLTVRRKSEFKIYSGAMNP